MPRRSARQIEDELRKWESQSGLASQGRRPRAEVDLGAMYRTLRQAHEEITTVYNKLSLSKSFRREAAELLDIMERLGLFNERNFG